MPRHYGHISGITIGTPFANRAAVAQAKVHTNGQMGIVGGQDGAESIVLSGGYVDDEDHGEYVIYTGMGGRDNGTGRQIADQSIGYKGNAGLIVSQLEGYPVRLVRGAGPHSEYAPPQGYRYDGLFGVTEHWTQIGRDGFQIVRFRLDVIDGFPFSPKVYIDDHSGSPVQTRPAVVQRQIRSTRVISAVKKIYRHECQICGSAIEVEGGRLYAEGAHIRGLGSPHFGPDEISNVLCLCPNDHVRFDLGAIYLSDDLDVVNTNTGNSISRLIMAAEHQVKTEHVAYHRSLWQT